MIFRQLSGVPDSKFMPHGLLRDLIFRQGLNEFVVDQQPVDKQDFFTGRIRRFEHDGTTVLAIFHAGENRAFD